MPICGPWGGGALPLASALMLIYQILFILQVLLVMTNGRQTVTPVISNVENLLAKASKPLKTNGVHIHPIVSSSDFDIFNMLRIASKAQNLAYPMDIDVMKYIASDIKNQIC